MGGNRNIKGSGAETWREMTPGKPWRRWENNIKIGLKDIDMRVCEVDYPG